MIGFQELQPTDEFNPEEETGSIGKIKSENGCHIINTNENSVRNWNEPNSNAGPGHMLHVFVTWQWAEPMKS